MKKITIPENIQLRDPLSDKVGEFVTFKKWFIETVLNDRRIGMTPVKLARVMTMMGKVTVATVGSALDLEDQDYDTCKAIVSEPELALGGPIVAAQMLPFAEAFLGAK